MSMLADKIDTILAKDALRWAVLRLQKERISSASLDGRILLEYVLGVNREQLLFSLELPITAEQHIRLQKLVEKRSKRQPIAQLIARREFWGMNFVVNGHTLDPRPDSETLVEYVLERVKSRGAGLRVLDLGTGTGCLLLSLLSELPAARGVGVDRCDKALLVAKENAMALGMKGRVEFVESHWCDKVEGEFDIILSNPPYIPTGVIATLDPGVSEFEPMLALDGGGDGLSCYREIMKSLPDILAEGGFVAFELGVGQQDDVERLAVENGLEMVGIRQDLGGVARCMILQRKSHKD